jgi:TrmH family RNA methyltransferase
MLTSIKNPLIKEIRKLHRSKTRHEENLFLLEGTNLITAAYEVNYPLEILCCTPEWQNKHEQLWEKVTAVTKRVELVTTEVIKAIATTVNPDGVIGVATRKPTLLPDSNLNLGLIIERMQDPGNLGTIIRTAVAAEVDGLWLSEDSVDMDHPKVLRASAGEWFRISMGMSSNLTSLIKNYQQQGIKIVASVPQAQKTYWEIDFTPASIILLGNEGAGLSEELISLADEQVRIPLAPTVESLNVAIAAALLLYEAQRQREKLKR